MRFTLSGKELRRIFVTRDSLPFLVILDNSGHFLDTFLAPVGVFKAEENDLAL